MVMDILASSSNSSIDLLAANNDDPRSSPVRDPDRIFKRSPLPLKNTRVTPTENRTYQLQDFYLATPTHPRSISVSPTRSLAEAENVISPWRIRVRVEAEREEAAYDSELDRLAQKPMSSHKTRSRATTMIVPLNDYSDPNTTPKQSGRVKKSTPKRRPTPKPLRSRKRVLETVENEASNRLPSPKRLKQKSIVELDHKEEAPIEDEETAPLHLDDLVEAAVLGNIDHRLNSIEGDDARAATIAIPSSTTTARGIAEQSRSSKPQRATSPFKFRRQGQENSVIQTAPLMSGHAKSRRRLLISDFAEPRQEFDSVVEGEDFSMVSLSSVPSAQQHLSLRKERVDSTSRATDLTRSRSDLRSPTASPTVVLQTDILQSQRLKQHIGSTAATTDVTTDVTTDATKLPLPTESLPRSPKYPKLRSHIASPSKTREPRTHSRSDETVNANSSSDNPPENRDQVAVPLDLEEDIPADIRDMGDFNFEEDSDQPGVVLPETFDLDAADQDSDPESPQFTEQKINQPYIEEHDSADDNLLHARDSQSREQEPVNHVDTRDVPPRATEWKPDKSNEVENRSYLEQSSMLQLPQARGTPSRLFSSPTLPNIAPQQNESNMLPVQKKIITPKLKRVVKAGKALQDVVEPAIDQQVQAIPEMGPVERQQNQPDDLFSGFSISTRRELRAGLRLGNELAKRQSSLMDITMHTVSSQAQPDTLPKPDANTSYERTFRSQKVDFVRKDASPVRVVQGNTQLPSPEISSNSTENKGESSLLHVSSLHDDGKPTYDAGYKSSVYLKDIPNGITEDDFLQEADGFDFQNQGFASDNEFEAPNAANELTDIWQLAADSTSFLQDPISQSTSLLPTAEQTNTVNVESDHQQPLLENSAAEDEDTESVLRYSADNDFDEEPAGTPAVIHQPTTLSDMLTPSDTDSSLHKDARPNQVEFTDFTGFTKDLLQAAANREKRQQFNDRISEERQEQTTPSDKVLQNHRPYHADVFTTKSFLETSPTSIKTKRFSPRKPISFRPTNRKESWLLDPSRLRKPPSPSKEVISSSASLLSESDLSDPHSLESDGEMPKHAQSSKVERSSSVLSGDSSSDVPLQTLPLKSLPLVYQNAKSSNHRLSPSPPALASQKDKARYSPDVRSSTPTREPYKALPVKNSLAKPIAATPSAQELQQKARINTQNLRTQPSSVSQSSQLSSQQSSFISNASSNTSYDADEAQPTWLSILTTVTTPLITSTKAFANLAATAFRHSQHETFYPTRKAISLAPAVLTIHMPFNDAHWSALQILYTTALEKPYELPLDLTDPCADYLGLEIESMGWKRELEEWELAIVAKFLQLLDEEGVIEDDEQDVIDVEDVVKRVFSLWVGMVTRGELEITDGIAGAWDRRFVSRRDEVLQRQKEWLKTHQ